MSEFIAAKLWPGAAVERSIFGTDDAREVWRQGSIGTSRPG
jgi:hypothetical protein